MLQLVRRAVETLALQDDALPFEPAESLLRSIAIFTGCGICTGDWTESSETRSCSSSLRGINTTAISGLNRIA